MRTLATAVGKMIESLHSQAEDMGGAERDCAIELIELLNTFMDGLQQMATNEDGRRRSMTFNFTNAHWTPYDVDADNEYSIRRHKGRWRVRIRKLRPPHRVEVVDVSDEIGRRLHKAAIARTTRHCMEASS